MRNETDRNIPPCSESLSHPEKSVKFRTIYSRKTLWYE
jgi:hypothetical protein